LPLEQHIINGRRDGKLQGWVSPETGQVVAAETWELIFDMDGDCHIVTAIVLEDNIPVTASLESNRNAEVLIENFAYSLITEGGRTSLRIRNCEQHHDEN
jgi:hypothetical protein